MFNPACSHYELCDNSKAFVREQTCHFSTKCIFTSYYVQFSVAPGCLPSRKENFVRQISRLNARGCPFNFSVKIKYRVVAVSPQCSCRLLYVHPCLSSHGACARACACVCVRCVRAHVRLWMLDCLRIWRSVACSFEGWRNLRGRLKYCAVIGIALSSVSSINVQFSI